MGNEDGDGMDGGVFGNKNWGGGRFSFEFFFQNQSCETGVLKTDDDNWEKGQINYFVGHQIGSCENFPLDSIGKNTNRIAYCTANKYPLKTMGTGNYGAAARKTCTREL